MSDSAANERRSFIRLYASGPSYLIGPLFRALDDLLVDGDWPEES